MDIPQIDSGAASRLTILLVEDNPGDVRLAEEALKDAGVQARMHVVGDGEEAIAFLRHEGRYRTSPHPDIILLDLNLPRKDGREVLAEVKADVRLRHIPVVVLTTSQSDKDILDSYNLHANCYVVKPVGLDQFTQVIQAIQGFWLEVVRLAPD
jgi:two-component system, chemotaxis family, response regulator Rcp1